MLSWKRTATVLRFTILPGIFFCFASLALGQFQSSAKQVVTISNVWSHTGVQPGGQINLAVVLDIQKPYHVNSPTAQDPYVPLKIQLVSAPDQVRSSTPLYPKPEILNFGSGNSAEKISVFTGRITAVLTMDIASSARAGEIPIQIWIRYQACDDRVCLFPVDLTNTVVLQVLDRAVVLRRALRHQLGRVDDIRHVRLDRDPQRLGELRLEDAVIGDTAAGG